MFIPSLQDVIHGCKSIPEDVILLVVHNLLSVVEKLHRAEIVHGDLSPEVFFLGDRLVSLYEYGRTYNAWFQLQLLRFDYFSFLFGVLILQSVIFRLHWILKVVKTVCLGINLYFVYFYTNSMQWCCNTYYAKQHIFAVVPIFYFTNALDS